MRALVDVRLKSGRAASVVVAAFLSVAAPLLVSAFIALAPASAQETITYTYDALGRLIAVNHGSSGPNAGLSSSYTYDAADNRTKVVVGIGSGTGAISLSPTTLLAGTVGTQYSQTISASGGSGSYSYSVSGGTLPSGLALNSLTGVLSGTPSTAGTYGFTITATDSASNTGSQQYSVAINNSCAGISFAIADPAPVDEGSSLSFHISKTGSTADTCTINYTTADGTAKYPRNYTARSGTLTFAPNTTGAGFAVVTKDDGVVTGPLTMYLNISQPSGAATISDSQAVGTINDIDGTSGTCSGVSFTIATNGAVTEGTNSVFTVTKHGTTTNSCSVSYATANGSAIAGTNYTAKSATLTFTSAQTSQTASVATLNTHFSGSKTFSMSLSSPTGGSTLGTPSSATATINGSGKSTCSGVSFAVNSVSNDEGLPLAFTITKTGATTTTCSVNYATADGTAVSGINYLAIATTTASFAASATTVQVQVTTYDDGVYHAANRYMYLNLSSATSGATITNAQGTGTLFEVDPQNICPTSPTGTSTTTSDTSTTSTDTSTVSSPDTTTTSSPDGTAQPMQPIC